jgi:hypothetical protein
MTEKPLLQKTYHVCGSYVIERSDVELAVAELKKRFTGDVATKAYVKEQIDEVFGK